jgi:hypothetical protein
MVLGSLLLLSIIPKFPNLRQESFLHYICFLEKQGLISLDFGSTSVKSGRKSRQTAEDGLTFEHPFQHTSERLVIRPPAWHPNDGRAFTM